MTQIESEKGILDKNLQNIKAKMMVYEEQITNLNRDIQILNQEIAVKKQKIDDLNAKAILLNATQKELETWKDNYSQLHKEKEKEIEDLKIQFQNIMETKVEFLIM